MKFFIDRCNAEKGLRANLFDVAGLDFFQILDEVGVIEAAKLGHHGFNKLIRKNDFADFDEVQIPHESAATIGQAVDESLGDEPTYRFACRRPTQLEMFDEQGLVELAAGFETEVDDVRPNKVDRRFGLRGAAFGFEDGARLRALSGRDDDGSALRAGFGL